MRSLAAWLVVALVMGLFVELGFRAFDHEWDVQMRRNAQMRELAGR